MDSTVGERIAERANQVKILTIILTILAMPFYVIGFVVGVAWMALRWTYAAVAVGFADARARWVSDDAG